MKNLKLKKFSDVNLDDEFFDSLKEDYPGFEKWFSGKATTGAEAYVFYNYKNKIDGFLYLKDEVGEVKDVEPALPDRRHLKVGTLKINAHGTKLGERFVKKIFDRAFGCDADDIYVTVFAKHEGLLALLTRYGFKEHGAKGTGENKELVLVRNLKEITGNTLHDFPYIDLDEKKYYLLAIYPEYHSEFLPDSILNNESHDIVQDVSHTNSIHKIYISGISATAKLKRGDVLLIYRTSDGKGKAFYRSVATSIGVVEETRRISSFKSESDFLKYAKPYSIFPKQKLKEYFATKQRSYIIRFTYNAALARRITRGCMIEKVGLGTTRRWDFMALTEKQLRHIADIGEIHESLIVD
ncbi:N-acetyltransferase [Ralstonia solanacearum]|uniref:N-acetyltransferase n=1 Tax=Ralstonia solanacearum TaxID=305 RepID=UPI0009C09B21|nr:N-acetyltransferase [Ralstonia solanacearum]